jgi:hypothetical protein
MKQDFLLAAGLRQQPIKPNQQIEYKDSLATNGFRPGRYRLSVELQGKNQLKTGSKQQLEFDLVAPQPLPTP